MNAKERAEIVAAIKHHEAALKILRKLVKPAKPVATGKVTVTSKPSKQPGTNPFGSKNGMKQ